MSDKKPVIVDHRYKRDNKAAIIFIHGYHGKAKGSWGRFPEFLSDNRLLRGWNMHSIGYASGLWFDIVGLWRADPPLSTLAEYLWTRVTEPPFAEKKSLAFIAHSMGGLIVQRALLDHEELIERTSHVVLFGTPSAGLGKASFVRRIKRQFRDMGHESKFIKSLRRDWNKRFRGRRPFKLRAVGGYSDTFVDRHTSVEPFPPSCREMIPGDHLSIVKPEHNSDLSVQVVLAALTNRKRRVTTVDSAREAVESREFHKAVKLLFPKRRGLDDVGLVDLALALEGVGRRGEAIQLLEERSEAGTDVMGVFAGRLKRRWFADHQRKDANRAYKLYCTAYDRADATGDHAQAFYHGINISFMNLAYKQERVGAKTMAKRVLQHCRKAKVDEAPQGRDAMWRLATEGEAYLVLREPDRAIDRYRQAVGFQPMPAPRELDSMYLQATQVVGLTSTKEVARRLEEVFSED